MEKTVMIRGSITPDRHDDIVTAIQERLADAGPFTPAEGKVLVVDVEGPEIVLKEIDDSEIDPATVQTIPIPSERRPVWPVANYMLTCQTLLADTHEARLLKAQEREKRMQRHLEKARREKNASDRACATETVRGEALKLLRATGHRMRLSKLVASLDPEGVKGLKGFLTNHPNVVRSKVGRHICFEWKGENE